MKVMVVKPNGGAFSYITRGFINAFNAIGCDARYWSGNADEFASFKPDLYIGSSGHRQVIPAAFRSSTKIAMHVNPFGKVKLDKVHGVDINETQDAINWTVAQKPNVVFGYGHQDDFSNYWNFWTTKFGLPFVGVPTAGDATLYWPDAQPCDYDIAYLGGYWQFKGHKLDKWLMPVIKDPGIAIMGWGGWGSTPGYRGVLADNDSGRVFLSSAKVGPCISEPHTSIYGIDIPERFFKVALCGILPISDLVPGFNRYYPDGMFVMADNPSDYRSLIVNYARNEDFQQNRVRLAQLIRAHTLKNHTYHTRMKNVCSMLGFSSVVEKFNDAIRQLGS